MGVVLAGKFPNRLKELFAGVHSTDDTDAEGRW